MKRARRVLITPATGDVIRRRAVIIKIKLLRPYRNRTAETWEQCRCDDDEEVAAAVRKSAFVGGPKCLVMAGLGRGGNRPGISTAMRRGRHSRRRKRPPNK